jgi:putative sterol carrier protein
VAIVRLPENYHREVNKMAEITLQDLMTTILNGFQPEKAKGVDATVQINLTGKQGGDWWVHIKDQICKVEEGNFPEARLKLSAEGQDILDIFTGKLDGMRAFMMGKLHLKGDMGLALKLATLFHIQQPAKPAA